MPFVPPTRSPARAITGLAAVVIAVLSPALASLILFGVFFGLMFLRVPIAFALGLACLPILLIEPRLDPLVLFNETFKSYNNFILLAVPFFLLTANLMNAGGISRSFVSVMFDDRTSCIAASDIGEDRRIESGCPASISYRLLRQAEFLAGRRCSGRSCAIRLSCHGFFRDTETTSYVERRPDVGWAAVPLCHP